MLSGSWGGGGGTGGISTGGFKALLLRGPSSAGLGGPGAVLGTGLGGLEGAVAEPNRTV